MDKICKTIFYSSLCVAAIGLEPAMALDAQNTAAAAEAFAKGKKEFEAKKYKEAQKDLDVAATQGSRNATIQYYLALAAAQNGDYATFKRALARIVVSNNTKTGVGQRALQLLQTQLGAQCKPYTVLNNGQSVSRFFKADMPIKIWISQGLMLPPQFRGVAPDRHTLPALIAQLNNPAFFTSLQYDPGYKSSLYGCVQRGLSKWDWARSEGILNWTFVTSPTEANVLVFWCPNFKMPGTAGFTANMNVGKQSKVVMQFVTRGEIPANILLSTIETNACHEFGHCFGLESHSPNPDDIMTAKLGPGANISDNDKLSLRALYDIAPDVRK